MSLKNKIIDLQSDVSRITTACPVLPEVLDKNQVFEDLYNKIVKSGYEGVFIKYLNGASAETLDTFFKQIARVDFDRVNRHRGLVKSDQKTALKPEDVDPARLVTLEEQSIRQAQDRAIGLGSLSMGEWATVAFAGGAGTRFFSSLDRLKDALPMPNEVIRKGRVCASMPKGAFPISPVAGLSFLEIFVAEALAMSMKTGKLTRVLLMTSPNTHNQTIELLSAHELWGFPQSGWLAFQQGQEPRLDADQDLIVADKQGNLCWTGDGHGGVYRALSDKGEKDKSLLEKLSDLGVRHLVMHNVDNPVARPLDPQRIGFHIREQAFFTMSAARKVDSFEKVGLLMQLRSSGKLEVVEYNELDVSIASLRNSSTTRLLHEAGNINTHLIAIEAVRPDIDPTIYRDKMVESCMGEVASSSIEMLSQHITRHLDPDRVRAYEVAREEFFMPTKNVTGPDSIETTTRMMAKGFAKRLTDAGAVVHQEALCDLHPACGSDGEELAANGLGPDWNIDTKSRLYLCIRKPDIKSAPVSEGSLHLESESTFILDAKSPYGKVAMDGNSSVHCDASAVCRARIGSGVVVKKGVSAVFRLSRGARLSIPKNHIIKENIEIDLKPNESIEL